MTGCPLRPGPSAPSALCPLPATARTSEDAEGQRLRRGRSDPGWAVQRRGRAPGWHRRLGTLQAGHPEPVPRLRAPSPAGAQPGTSAGSRDEASEVRRCGRARLGPVSPRRAPWPRMRDPNAPNPQDMQRPPSHCAKRGPGADVQAKAAPPARLRRSETVFQIKAYLKNNKTWRLGKAPARPDAAVEVGGADRGRERSRHGGGPQTKPSELSPSDRMPPGALAAAHTSLSRPRS